MWHWQKSWPPRERSPSLSGIRIMPMSRRRWPCFGVPARESRPARAMSCRSRGSAATPLAGRSRKRRRLLVVSSCGRVRLPDGAVLHAHPALSHSGELLIGLVVEVFGDVLGRGIQDREGLQVVEHLVVDAVDDRTQHLVEQLEIEQEASLVQRGPGQGDADLIVMPVRVLALALVVAQIVAGGETGLHGDFIHRRQLLSCAGNIPDLIILLFSPTLAPCNPPR